MNNIVYIPLKIQCPQQCICSGNEIRNQTHSSCKTQLFVNFQGDIFCQKYLNGQGCQPSFVKEFSFQCEKAKKNNSSHKYMNGGEFMMALAQAAQSCEFSKQGDDILEFINKLTSLVVNRWHN